MFPKIKPPRSHVPHNGKGLIGGVEKLDQMRMSGVKMDLPVHPVDITPPHPHRLRKRF